MSYYSNGNPQLMRSKLQLSNERNSSPEGRVLSPDVLKRIIEGHETEEIFEECSETRDYDDRADLLVHELTKYINKWVYLTLTVAKLKIYV